MKSSNTATANKAAYKAATNSNTAGKIPLNKARSCYWAYVSPTQAYMKRNVAAKITPTQQK